MFDDFMEELRRRQAERQAAAEKPSGGPVDADGQSGGSTTPRAAHLTRDHGRKQT